MANDRIYIVCSHCGDKKLLAKYYPTLEADTWPAAAVPVGAFRNLGLVHVLGDVGVVLAGGDFHEWMYTHMHSPCRPVAKDLAGDPGFFLVTESE